MNSAIDPNIPPILQGDPYWLRQILINLVSNAIKFTDQGQISIKISQMDSQHWTIQVADTGSGIPEEAQDYIFEAFRQIDGTETRGHGGSGLGLSIVKELTLLMGGQINLESRVGQGTVFTISLPLIQLEEQIA